jgi:hypothetical protein
MNTLFAFCVFIVPVTFASNVGLPAPSGIVKVTVKVKVPPKVVDPLEARVTVNVPKGFRVSKVKEPPDVMLGPKEVPAKVNSEVGAEKLPDVVPWKGISSASAGIAHTPTLIAKHRLRRADTFIILNRLPYVGLAIHVPY